MVLGADSEFQYWDDIEINLLYLGVYKNASNALTIEEFLPILRSLFHISILTIEGEKWGVGNWEFKNQLW